MKRTLAKIALFTLLAAAIVVAPGRASAENMTTNAPAAEHKEKKKDTGSVHGKISAIDAKAMTVTLGKHTYEVTSETKIFKGDKPATLAEGAVGDEGKISYKNEPDGKKEALKISFGPKSEKEEKPKEETK